MNRRTVSGISIVLYVLAALVGAYTVWAVVHFYGYLTEMISQGQLIVSGSEFEIANFLMSNALQYGLFAVILFALGRVLQLQTLHASGVVYDDDFEDDEFEDEGFEDEAEGFEDEADEDEADEGWLRSDDDEVAS